MTMTIEEEHGSVYRYEMGCRCLRCENTYRVHHAMRGRRKYRGYYWIRHDHDGLEARYPDELLEWIRKGSAMGKHWFKVSNQKQTLMFDIKDVEEACEEAGISVDEAESLLARLGAEVVDKDAPR